ncbi:MAG TPA: hypothetical protein VLD63_14960 [Anaerolineales bacterium]|nr:hypothetical protein [Anaerolineales bacterium]
MDSTRPTSAPTRRTPIPSGSRRPPRLLLAAGAGLALAAIVVAGSGFAGYQSGVALGHQTQVAQGHSASQEQFDLGVADLLAARYDLAIQRFEYVLELEPNYPGVTELLEKARAGLNQPTNTPGPTATPITPTPTLDVASLDGLFSQAQAAFVQEDWGRTLEALLVIRSREPSFRRDEANSMMAQALRNRGVGSILRGDIEQGIYDLALAERFGLLDNSAVAWRNSGAFYLFANSYFGLDWQLAAANFESLCRADLWDSCTKYARAAYEYGHLLLAQSEPCDASDQYAISLRLRDNPPLEPTATYAARVCATLTAPTPTGTITPTPTPSLTGAPPIPTDTDTPTPPSGPSDTPPPTETPSPTPTETPTETPT